MFQRMRVGLVLAVLLAVGISLGGTASASTVDETDFTRGTLSGSGFSAALPTSLAFGPDGRLYVADQEGRIQALTLGAAGTSVSGIDVVTLNGDLQEVYGIAFDPNDASVPPPVYATNTISGFGAGGPSPAGSFPGKVTKIDGVGYSAITDIITGLSASDSAHQANGLTFGPDGRLYIDHGSTTNAGVVNPNPGLFQRPDVPLSGAVLVADIHAGGFDGNVTYSPANTYASTVDQISGDVDVYASGLRNPYDLVWHSNGNLYTTDNGTNAGLGGASTSCATEDPDPWFPETRSPDELNLIVAGDYYGQPNRNRGRFDVRQCIYYNGTDGDGPTWTGPIDLLPVSSNGLVEYTAGIFGGKLQGNLFYAGFNDGLLGRIVLSGDGLSVVSNETFASSFNTPLDVTAGPDGTIYIAEYGASRITYLKPNAAVGGVPLGGSLRGLPGDSGTTFGVWMLAGLLAVMVAGSSAVGAFVKDRSRR